MSDVSNSHDVNLPHVDHQESGFRAVVQPHRSLSPGGFLFVMFVVAFVALGSGLLFSTLGAWPVLGFMGLDFVLIFWAFQANYFSGRAREEYIIDHGQLIVRSISAHGEETSVTLNPHWVKLIEEHVDEIGTVRLALRIHGKELDIGTFLSPVERQTLARGLGQALARARSVV